MKNFIRKIIKKQINILFENSLEELNSGLTRDQKQIDMARRLMGDDSIIVLNKLDFGEELTFSEMEEARDKYLADYIFAKAKLNGKRKVVNPINLEDLEAIFNVKGNVLDGYMNILVNKFSNVEQISDLERSALLNIGGVDTPTNASNEIAKKYIIKMLLNLDVPQAGDNKWTRNDSIEAHKAYQIAMTDEEFRNIVEKVLQRSGKQNSRLYRKLKKLSIPPVPEKPLEEIN